MSDKIWWSGGRTDIHPAGTLVHVYGRVDRAGNPCVFILAVNGEILAKCRTPGPLKAAVRDRDWSLEDLGTSGEVEDREQLPE